MGQARMEQWTWLGTLWNGWGIGKRIGIIRIHPWRTQPDQKMARNAFCGAGLGHIMRSTFDPLIGEMPTQPV